MSNILVCPSCKKGLRTSAPVAAGKKIKCPACATLFAASGDGAAAAVQAKAPPPVLTKAAPVRQAKAARPVDVVEEVDDFDEPSPRRRRRDSDDRPVRRKKSGSMLGLIVGLCGGVALLAIFGVTAFVWPGFLLSGRASQARTLLAYVPADSTVVAGAQVGLVRKDPQFAASWNELQQKVTQLPDFPPEARELLNDADEIVVGTAGTNANATAVFAASTERPYDVEKVKRLAKAGAAVNVQGQTIYPTNNLIAGKQSFLALPTDKIMVLGVMPQEQFAKLLVEAPKARLHADLQEQIDHAHTALVWVGVRFDENIKQQLQKAQGQLGPAAMMLGPDGNNILAAIQRGKGALLAIDFRGQKLKVSVGMTCADGNDAGLLKTGVSNVWNAQAKQMIAMGDLFGAGVPGLSKLLAEVQQSFAVELRSTTVIASIEVNQDTLQQVSNAAQKNFVPPGGGFAPPFPKNR
jgi:hypothetical protein